jgi:hypothetical protein
MVTRSHCTRHEQGAWGLFLVSAAPAALTYWVLFRKMQLIDL